MNEKRQVTFPKGFQAAGISSGIKKSGAKDLALIFTESHAAVAGTFTTNQVQAATVRLCRDRLQRKGGQALVVNSGNANTCTGEQGEMDAREMGRVAAEALGIKEDAVFVCSTGHIGVNLPMDKISIGIQTAAGELRPDGGGDVSTAIMTTDTREKTCIRSLSIDGKNVTLTGIAKGAGMIDPRMATMLCFLLTDAAVEAAALQRCLSSSVEGSFNRISVDGDRSTNDTVLFFANGAAGNLVLDESHADWGAFQEAVDAVTLDLALQIVRDGEGAEKLVTLMVQGAKNDEEADQVVRSIANSFLVKTSWAGNYPNWGRIMAAIGYTSTEIDQKTVDLFYNDRQAVKSGLATDVSMDQLKEECGKSEFTIRIDLHLGGGEAMLYTCECSEEYVRINVLE